MKPSIRTEQDANYCVDCKHCDIWREVYFMGGGVEKKVPIRHDCKAFLNPVDKSPMRCEKARGILGNFLCPKFEQRENDED